jgi:periplasmic protein TonB
MNNIVAMDRAEKIGLGAAVGGHALLLALLVFGLFQAAKPIAGNDGGGSGDGIAVEIINEIAASAPAAAPTAIPDPVEAVEPVVAPPEIMPDTVVDPLPTPKQTPKSEPKPAQKILQKTVPQTTQKTMQQKIAKPVPKPVAKMQTKPATKLSAAPSIGQGAGSSAFEKNMERTLGGLGSGNGPKSKTGAGAGVGNGASVQAVGQIKSLASAAIATEVRPLIPGCAPSTSDNSSLRVFVQLSIGQAKNLISANVYDVQGVTPSNAAQVAQMKKCVLDSLRAASPYNLDAEGYETWRNHKVQLKVNFK